MFRLPTYKSVIFIIFWAGIQLTVYSQKEIRDSDVFFAKAKQAALKEDFQTATSYCEKAIELAPLDMDIKEYLGKCYMEIGKLEKARITLLEVLKSSPKRVDARHYLLNLETQAKRYSSAVCYANELLEITPYSKQLWIKKINLYRLMGNAIEAKRAANRLYQIYPEDTQVKYLRNSILKDNAMKMAKGNELALAAIQYEDALQSNPADVDSYLSLINVHLKLGNTTKAIEVANRALNNIPGNPRIIDKKIGILQKDHHYAEALNIVENQIRKKAPGNYYRLRNYLLAEFARYQRNQDPYELYSKLYDRNKNNNEAFNYLVSTAIARGYYTEAERLLTEKLKKKPGSKEILSKLMITYEAQNKTKPYRATLTKLHHQYPNDYDISERYNQYQLEEAKEQFVEQNYKEAEKTFVELSMHSQYDYIARQYLYSIRVRQKKYEEAEKLINKLIDDYPEETKFKLRKIDLYANMNRYDEAYRLINQYLASNPNHQEYQIKKRELSIAFIKYEAENENWKKVKTIADELIRNDTTNFHGYNYAIGARLSLGEYQEAETLIQSALDIFPDSRDLQLKLAGAYSMAGDYKNAIKILQDLHHTYPYHTSIQGSLIEALYRQGKFWDEHDSILLANGSYSKILELNPKEVLASIKSARNLVLLQKMDEAMRVIDQSLSLNKGDHGLQYEKGIIYEKMEDYENALFYQKQYIPPYHKLKEHKDHLAYLESKLLHNQVNLAYLRAINDSSLFGTSVSTFEYMRFAGSNTCVARINYAGRTNGVGLQGEIDWVHHFKNKSYTTLNIGASERFFPQYQIGIDYASPVSTTWMGEIGLKYVKTRSEINFYTAHIGAEKYYKNIWLNLKLYAMTDQRDYFHNILFQSRIYMQNEKDYLLAMASMGSVPENEKLDFQINSFLFYTNSMVGAGYNHQFNSKSSVAILGNWYNYQVRETRFLNQFNIFIIVKTKF